jgi:hypothetical protein
MQELDDAAARLAKPGDHREDGHRQGGAIERHQDSGRAVGWPSYVSPDQHDGHARVPHDAFRHASEAEPVETSPTVRCHGDETHPPTIGSVDDHLAGIAVPYLAANLQPRTFQPAGLRSEILARLRLRRGLGRGTDRQ